jgi:hypothetical protein
LPTPSYHHTHAHALPPPAAARVSPGLHQQPKGLPESPSPALAHGRPKAMVKAADRSPTTSPGPCSPQTPPHLCRRRPKPSPCRAETHGGGVLPPNGTIMAAPVSPAGGSPTAPTALRAAQWPETLHGSRSHSDAVDVGSRKKSPFQSVPCAQSSRQRREKGKVREGGGGVRPSSESPPWRDRRDASDPASCADCS